MTAAKNQYTLSMIERADDVHVNQWVYQVLRRSIMCGEIRPGIALTIRGLAEKLAVSPMPVREALHKLASQAAVEVRDNRRVTVPLISPDKFKELYELRIILETHAAAKALAHIGSTELAELKRLDGMVDRAYADGDVMRGSLANQAFHRYLYSQNPIQVCLPMIESLWLQLGPFVRIGLSKLESYYANDRHQEALDAIEKQDVSRLVQAIESDIRDGISLIKNVDQLYQDLGGS
ncbi:MAG: GntR family transcriptional regulator [Leucothrix sp.]